MSPSPEKPCCKHHGAENAHTLCSADDVVPIVDIITTAMADAGYREKDIFDLRLALEEAMVNAVKHGNRCDPGKRVHVRYHISSEHVVADIEDQGPGFDPEQVPNPTTQDRLERPGGRGLLLIRAYTTWARYNERGNCITLCKRRSER